MTQEHNNFSIENNKHQKTITRMSMISASPDQVSSRLGDESVILNIKTGIYFGLNEVGTRVWSLIQKPATMESIINTLMDEYDVDPQQCEADVLALVNEMIKAVLVEVDNGKVS